MGIFKRKNDAVNAMNAAEQAMPGAYQSKYKDRINAALDALGGSGTDSAVDDLTSQAFDQYRQRAGQNASAAAQNAVDVTNGLSGGYGSSWAGNVAQQGYNEQMAAVDDALPSFRTKASSRVQDQQNSLTDLLNAMMTQENMDQSEHSGSVADAQNWRDYTASRADTARQEVSNFWNNAWNAVKNAGSAALTAYDTYKGYTQQQWENDFAKEQWEYNKGRTDKSDALSAYEQAFNLYQQGAGDAAQEILNQYGLNADAFANYTGAPITRADQASVLSTAASLVAAGNNEAAENLLKLYEMDAGAAGNYDTVANRTLATTLAKSAATKSGGGSSRSSGSSGTSSGSTKSSGFTNSQLQSMAKSFSSMTSSDPLYSFYKQTLTDAGWLDSGTGSGGATNDRRIQLSLDPGSKWGSTGTTGGSKAAQSGQTGSNKGSGMSYQDALSRAQKWKADGVDEDTIYARLVNQGVTDDVAAKVWNAMGW